jgi:hypothetical protein
MWKNIYKSAVKLKEMALPQKTKKSGKTPLETIPLYIKLARGHVNGAEIPVAIINRKNIADWCFNYREILATPSFFVVRPFLYM